MPYLLISKLERTFRQGPYRHRNANLGNRIADCLLEDLVAVDETSVLAARARQGLRILNPAIVIPGLAARRGDGSFGEPVPGVQPTLEDGYVVLRGRTATVEIGCEVKIVAKAMGKQIDRVIGDLQRQAAQFQSQNTQCLTVGVVGVNFSDAYTSFEGERAFHAFGAKAPGREAPKTVERLAREVSPHYDALLTIGFRATNEPPFPFQLVEPDTTHTVYGSTLIRLVREYERRFAQR